MPPADSHKSLTAAQKETIRRWIEQGAQYQKHWSFEPPVRPEIPVSSGLPKGNAGNAIDAFIRARLSKEGLAPSPEADRATLLRRLSLDLTGLPPTVEEMNAFLADRSSDAYEKQVGRLLASPHFGEQMAAAWLDVSRYGDTNGYLARFPPHGLALAGLGDSRIQCRHALRPIRRRAACRRSASQGKTRASPGDGFLPQSSDHCRRRPLAAEYLNEYAADRVQTFGTAFLGLSINCCRCHDHKFDPLTQKDFYSLEAYFNSITEKHVENDPSPAYCAGHRDRVAAHSQRRKGQSHGDAGGRQADTHLRLEARSIRSARQDRAAFSPPAAGLWSNSARCAAEPARLGAMDRFRQESALCASRRESHLAADIRHRAW